MAVVVRFLVATTAAGVEADASVLLVVLGGPGTLLAGTGGHDLWRGWSAARS